MGVEYLRGNPVSAVERFWTVDPLDASAIAPADPTTVTFTLLAPDGSEQRFDWPGAAEIDHPEVGVFVLTVPPPAPGEWRGRAEGAGALVQAREFSFTVVDSSVDPLATQETPENGPCGSWIYGADVLAFDATLSVGSDPSVLDDVAAVASSLLYELSGRRFSGVCERTVRPCADRCGCWSGALGLGPFYWSSSEVAGFPWGWGWRSEGGGYTGCGGLSSVPLAGYPVREVLSVSIDGETVDPAGYRLDERRLLVRLADTSTDPPTDRVWPACQDMTLPDGAPGTFSVTYRSGIDPPMLGRWAAAQLAAELWKAFPGNQGECRLPSRVTRVARSGITMERILPTAELLRSGQTGLQMVDSFLSQVNPTQQRRRSAVWSPDVEPFARHLGE